MAKSGNLFRTGARWDFPEQLAGRSYKRKPKMRMHIITIPLLQIRQISEMAGAACHGEGYQCPARSMSLTRAECHLDGGPRGGSEDETSCTSFWRRAVHNSRCRQTMKHGYDALNMRNECRKIPRREGDVAEEGQWRRVVELCLQFIIAM